MDVSCWWMLLKARCRRTRFVLQKALQIGLKPIVVVNKIGQANCRPEVEVYEMVFDLMFSLEATEEQLDFPVIYRSRQRTTG